MEFFIDDNDYGLGVNKGILPPVYKMNFIQLPVREREYFGEWLNVSWDTDLAINVLATDIHARVDAENRDGYRVMRAAVEREVKLLDVSASLIVCKTDDLLDNIAQLEEDFNLPRGVNSRRNKLYNSSYYDATNVNPSNVEEHIKYAKMGGFRSMKIRYRDIVESAPSWGKNGDFDWRASIYPNGSEDLKVLLETIKSEGITPGLHFLPSSRTIGTQPDMIEYATSLAAAWDCPVSLNASLESFKNHARTADNLEVFRRWEEVRSRNWLTEEQKLQLRDAKQEYHLLLNEQNQFELHPYEQITTVAGSNEEIRAFIFQREGEYHVVYWHISGNKKLELPLDGKNVALYKNIDREEEILSTRNGDIVVPANDRKYLKISNVSKEKIFEAFENARIFE